MTSFTVSAKSQHTIMGKQYIKKQTKAYGDIYNQAEL